MPLIGGKKTLRSGRVTSSGNIPGAIRPRRLSLPNPLQLPVRCAFEHRLNGRHNNTREWEHTARLLVEHAAEVRLVDAEAARDDRQVPYRLDRRLGREQLAVRPEDLLIGAQPPLVERVLNLGEVEVTLGDRDRRAEVEVAAREARGEDGLGDVAPRVERGDPIRYAPVMPVNQRPGACASAGRGGGGRACACPGRTTSRMVRSARPGACW